MGNLIITDKDGKVVEQEHIAPAQATGERSKNAKPMKEDGKVQWHRSFAREREPER